MSSGNIPALTDHQARYVRSCVRIRKSMTYAAIAKRLGVSKTTVWRYAANKRTGRDG
jgi:DNA invertase Pin-like site-specific DNA recombinase